MKNLLRYILFSLLLAAVMVLGNGSAFGQLVWTKDVRNPVLSGGVSGAWNRHLISPSVLYNADSARYEMWFGALPSVAGGRPFRIGFAFSPDGINWTIYPTAVLSPDPGTWDAVTVEAQTVIRENGQYKMWYAGWINSTAPSSIGYATSSDGIHWTKYPGNPVLGPGIATWEAGGPYGCTVMPVSGGYKMWYSGYDASFSVTRIGYATSANGINWIRDTLHSPVLNVGAPGQWDDGLVVYPIVLRINNQYYMWYTGGRSGPAESGAGGIAVSSDGVSNWTRHTQNPVITTGSPGSWDATYVGMTSVLLRGDTLHMWYDGSRTPTDTYLFRIGHATSPRIAVGVEEPGAELPMTFDLSQNHPNPFNPSTRIRYQLPTQSHVRLKVYDVLGREIASLVDGIEQPGYKSVQWDAGGVASGVYFYRLQAGEFTSTKRLLLLK